MKKPKILVVGSFVMDLIVRSKRFVNAGETILGDDYNTASGGKGANQAVQAALLGANVSMLGKVGEDAFGKEMVESLNKAGVDTSMVLKTNKVSSAIGNVQIQSNEQGTQNRIVVVSGANMTITPEEVAFLKEDISNFDMVIMQLEIPMEINEIVAEYAYNKGVPVMLNPAPSAPLSDKFLSHLTYISPNEHEAADIVGFPVTDDESCLKALKALHDKGVKKVLITRGSDGAVYSDENGIIFSSSVKCEKVLDPTAAGDSFIGAFCTATCYGLTAEDALKFANHTASITVSRLGAQPSLPTVAEVLDFMKSKNVENIEKFLVLE
ncbi:MAG: ribokinase [Christensenellaceae bacterium]|nr:ribokinase [Christensenellaceae bacterium]